MLLLSSGCTFINTGMGDGNGGNGGNGGLPNSLISAQSVIVSEANTEGRAKMDLVDAVAKVERSAVAIKMSSSSSTGFGSGVIVDIETDDRKTDEYYILTCHHVIASGGNITVYLPDENLRNFTDADYNTAYAFSGEIGRQIYNNPVTLVGGDKDSDVAVLKLDVSKSTIDKNNVVEVQVPPSNYSLRKGEGVFAIGNPTGYLPGTLSVGNVSYINRDSTIGEVGHMTLNQLNLDTYPGSSGGGLYNYYGELVGLTNAGNTEDLGLNYAICISNSTDEQKDTGFKIIAKQLVSTASATNYGYVSGRWQLGINIGANQDFFGNTNVYVSGIEENGNAYKAGIRLNDVIKSITYGEVGSEKTVNITSESEFITTVFTLKKLYRLGNSFNVNVLRQTSNNGTTQSSTFNVTLTEQFIFCDTGSNS